MKKWMIGLLLLSIHALRLALSVTPRMVLQRAPTIRPITPNANST